MPKLLLVDDSTVIRSLMLDRLARSGLALDAIVEAASGAAAIERLGSERDIDLVLCDARLPGAVDFELLRAIRARFPRDRHRVVIVCAAGDVAAAEQALAAGADGTVERPFTSSDIFAALAAWCAAPSVSRRAG